MTDEKAWRAAVVAGIRAGKPPAGPAEVHVDITNGCNAACVTCWDHSPLLREARPAAWKRQRLPLATFQALVDDLAGLGSVRAVVLSGMGEPLTHPDVYEMIARIKAQGWHLTLMTNLVAADADRLQRSGVDQLLVGVHGATPATYTAFHPGWTEQHFFTLCKLLRAMSAAGTRVRHVHVINADTAPELVAMVRFGQLFGADRVNFKLASLADGTEGCAISPAQRDLLRQELVPRARAMADALRVRTNLDLFAAQLQAAAEDVLHTTPMDAVGCYMGHVYTRISVEGQVLFCCNTQVQVGHLDQGPVSAHWSGPTWQAARERAARQEWWPGCERCGKFEQNVKWSKRVRSP
ncbi:radical SAM protein [Myxococcota bacterium]|nr:radical SAM protein [Myxococcota bacterium]